MTGRATLAELIRLLRAAPRPDEDYLRLVESVAKKQPALPPARPPR